MNLPLVTFGCTELAIQHPFYDTDNIDFGYRAAHYLLGLGRRQLVMLTPPQQYLYGWHRKVGFQRALLEAGLDFDEHRQLLIEANATDYRARTREWQNSDWQPDGFICGTEIAAMGILAGLHDSGRVVRSGHSGNLTLARVLQHTGERLSSGLAQGRTAPGGFAAGSYRPAKTGQ